MTALSDVQTSLSLFAEAIAGHPVGFEVADEVDLCWPRSAERTSHARADGVDVRLPQAIESRGAYRTMVLHEVLVAAAPIPPEVQRSRDRLLVTVYALVEDARVSSDIRRRFPGAAADLNSLLTDVLVEATNAMNPQTNLAETVVAAVRWQALGATLDLRQQRFTSLQTRVLNALNVVVQDACVPGSTSQSSYEAAQRVCELVAALQLGGTHLDTLVGELVPDEDEPGLPTEGTTGVSLDGGTPSEFSTSDGISGGQLLGDGDDQPITDSATADEDQPQVGFQLPATTGGVASARERRTFVYDEWDYHDQQYRKAWCRVIEEELVGDDHGFILDVRSRHQALRTKIRRSMMQLRPQDLVRVHRSDDGDELDIDAAIEAMADRRSGAPVDDRLHIRRDRAARDVATVFLVDLSASTSSPASPPEPDPEPLPEFDPMDDPMSYGPSWQTPPNREPVRRVIDVAKDAVALMGDALHELGDRYAIYGFSGTGRDNVEFKIGKDFDDRVSATSWANIAAMKPLRYTRMGPAVRHATAKLAAQPARTRILVVVSDGYPQDADYGRDRLDREYGVHDTGRALSDAGDLGIETFCVTIDPAGHDYLRTMCQDDRYLVIEDVESLPAELASVYLQRLGR